jgi:hypothetical protein
LGLGEHKHTACKSQRLAYEILIRLFRHKLYKGGVVLSKASSFPPQKIGLIWGIE